MDKPHKQVIATSPVAINRGQTRIHVIPFGTWHRREEILKCPQCETEFFLTDAFPKDKVLQILEKHHKNREEHPDFIASDPAFTHIENCECGN